MNEIKNSKEIAHSCRNILASDTPDVMLVMCYDADLHKMQLTSAGKKVLTFVSIQSGDISVYRSCHILLQPSAVTSSSDKRR